MTTKKELDEKTHSVDIPIPPVAVSTKKIRDAVKARAGCVARRFDEGGNLKEEIRIAG